MEEKYIKFYKTFHKKFKNDKNLIHCSNLVSDSRMSKLAQIISSPFWAAGILTVILLTAGNYKWWLFGIYVLLAFFGKLYIKNNEKGLG